jgi:D-psicose/D-tagatose/L-ribulose 3-epimerase
MKYGVNTFIWTANFDRSNLHLLPAIKAAGFDGVEVPLFQPSQFAASDIRKGIADNGLECTICSILTGGMNVISGDAAVREKTRIHLQDCAKAAAEVGAKIVAGPLYSPVGLMTGQRPTDDEWKRAVDCYQAIGPTLSEYGVTIALEPLNRFETYFLTTAADAVALCDAIGHPNVGILFDTFHANIEEKACGGRLPRCGQALEARTHVRERPRHSRHGPRGLARRVPGAARCALRRLADDRELRFRAGRVIGGGLHLAGHRAVAGVDCV